MSFYLITGKMGTGKSKTATAFIRRALRKNLKVATNLDIRLEKLMPPMSRATLVRVPDKPVIDVDRDGAPIDGGRHDLEAIGHGNPDSFDEEFNGIIVLDELATWMNARTFQDKSRGAVVEWLRYSRKKGWHCYFITHDVEDIDKQVRNGLVEYVVRLVRFDKVKIPFVGGLLNTLSFGKVKGTLPRTHYAVTRMGTNPMGVVADRLMYRGDDLHDAYNTRQTFSENYPHGAHSLLSAWHLVGRYQAPALTRWERLRQAIKGSGGAVRRAAPTVPRLPLVETLSKLPPDERIRHWKRFAALGAFDPPSLKT